MVNIYTLVCSNSEVNHAPVSYTTKEGARKAMRDMYNSLIENDDYVDHSEIFEDSGYIVYIDDTYTKFDIFESELY